MFKNEQLIRQPLPFENNLEQIDTPQKLIQLLLKTISKLPDSEIYKLVVEDDGTQQNFINPPYITAYYDFLELIESNSPITPLYKEAKNKVIVLLTHDLIEHVFCRQSTSVLSDENDMVALAQVEEIEQKYKKIIFDPFQVEQVLEHQIMTFISLGDEDSTIYREIIVSFGKKYKVLRAFFNKCAESKSQITLQTPRQLLQIFYRNDILVNQFKLMLIDFRRWLVWRGVSKYIRMEFGERVLYNCLNSGHKLDLKEPKQIMKARLKALNQKYFTSKNKESFNSYTAYNESVAKDPQNTTYMPLKVDDRRLQDKWDYMSKLFIRILRRSEVEGMFRSFAELKNPELYEATRIHKF